MFVKKSISKWIPLFRVEKILTNSNYIVRKVGTHYTQCVHRIRLRPIEPKYEVKDLEAVDTEKFEADPILEKIASEPELFDNCLPSLLYDTKIEKINQNQNWGTPFLFIPNRAAMPRIAAPAAAVGIPACVAVPNCAVAVPGIAPVPLPNAVVEQAQFSADRGTELTRGDRIADAITNRFTHNERSNPNARYNLRRTIQPPETLTSTLEH